MTIHHWRLAVAGVAATSTALIGLVVASPTAHADATTCTTDVGGSGLSAAVVAHAHERIANRTIDAGTCDIGIYVGAGATHVTISGVTVTNAGFQGIFAEKTSHLVIEGSTVTGNGFRTIDPAASPLPGNGLHSYVGQSFAISLFGVSHSSVLRNHVYNNGRGGIGLMDNGANDPGWLMSHQNPDAPLIASTHDVIAGNTTSANYGGCGIVAATQNFGGRLDHVKIRDNTITGSFGYSQSGPDIGGIVVAADLPGSTVSNVNVSGNSVTKSFEGGIIVNAEAFNSSTNSVHVTDNSVSANNWGFQEAPTTAGVIVYANPGAAVPPTTSAPRNVHTTVTGNTISDQFYGIWSWGDYAPKTSGNSISVTSGGTPIFHG